ncbi:unnamed protein product [Ixodes pacificus]
MSTALRARAQVAYSRRLLHTIGEVRDRKRSFLNRKVKEERTQRVGSFSSHCRG